MRRFRLDPREGRLLRGDEVVALTPKAFALLLLLVEERGKLVTKEAILARVWPGTSVTEASIKDHVKHVRRALDDEADEPRHIETVRGRGYRYIGDVTLVEPCVVDAPALPTIAVLPFAVLGADGTTDHVSIGISQDILCGLGCYRELVVIAHFSSFQLRELDPIEASGRLQARWLVVGSARLSADRLRLNVQLVEGSTGRQVWAEQFDSAARELMAVEDQVVRAIVCTIAGQIERAETEVARARPIEDLTAYERVLFARHQLARATQADVLAAREILARVHAELPHFATACTWLAETYYYEAHSAWSTDPDGAARTAFELGRCAVELDDRDSLAHLVLAWGYFRVYRSIELASAQLALARAVNPNDYYGLCLASGLCLWDGDLDGAITHGLAALRRSPLTPDTCMRYFGLAHFCSERYEQALDAFSRMKSPGVDVLGAIAACYGLLGREEQAAQAAELFRARSLAGGGPLADPEAWHAYWTRVLPFRDRRYLDRLLDGLARAGLPGGPTSSAS